MEKVAEGEKVVTPLPVFSARRQAESVGAGAAGAAPDGAVKAEEAGGVSVAS